MQMNITKGLCFSREHRDINVVRFDIYSLLTKYNINAFAAMIYP